MSGNPYPLTIYEAVTGRLPGWRDEPIAITIPAGSVSAGIEDFPVMIHLSDDCGTNHADLSGIINALGSDANRFKICITDSDGITPLYVEIKQWSYSDLEAFLWVKVPEILPGLDKVLYLYYDVLHADNTAFVGDIGSTPATQVWSNGYGAVWHMVPDSGYVKDSTANGNDAAISGALQSTGPTGVCLDFDGVNDGLTIPDSATIRRTVGMACESFCYPTGDGISDELFCKLSTYVLRALSNEATRYFGWYIHNGTTWVGPNTGNYDIADYDAFHVVGAWDDDQTQRIYLNGGEESSISNVFSNWTTSSDLTIGYRGTTAYVDGPIFFSSISQVERSAAWVAASSASLHDDLVSYGEASRPVVPRAYVDGYQYLEWHRKYRRPGTFLVRVNENLAGFAEMQAGRLVHLKRNGEDRLGVIVSRQRGADQRGKASEIWTIAGRELAGVLNDRSCLHGISTGTGYDEITDEGETAIRNYVEHNAINPSDYRRVVPFLMQDPDGELGTEVTKKARMQVLTDIIEEICLASGIGWRFRWDWEDYRAYLEVYAGTDRSGNVKFSPALGNCTVTGYNETIGATPSMIYVAGQGEEAARTIQEVYADTEAPIGWDRRERVVDARDQDTTDGLITRGEETLAEDGDTTSLEIDYINDAGYVYGTDFDLGDIVHVEYPGIAEMDTRIIEILETYERVKEGVTLTLGTEWGDLISITRKSKKQDAETRR